MTRWCTCPAKTWAQGMDDATRQPHVPHFRQHSHLRTAHSLPVNSSANEDPRNRVAPSSLTLIHDRSGGNVFRFGSQEKTNDEIFLTSLQERCWRNLVALDTRLQWKHCGKAGSQHPSTTSRQHPLKQRCMREPASNRMRFQSTQQSRVCTLGGYE
jgi:hypothetical protein